MGQADTRPGLTRTGYLLLIRALPVIPVLESKGRGLSCILQEFGLGAGAVSTFRCSGDTPTCLPELRRYASGPFVLLWCVEGTARRPLGPRR